MLTKIQDIQNVTAGSKEFKLVTDTDTGHKSPSPLAVPYIKEPGRF